MGRVLAFVGLMLIGPPVVLFAALADWREAIR